LGKLNLLLHSVAFAPKAALEGEFVNTTREAYRVAHDSQRDIRWWRCPAPPRR